MQRFIGIDVHGQSCTLVVMGPSGRRLGEYVVETNAKVLIDRMRSIAGDKYVCMEEGTQCEWLCEVLAAHAKQIVVTQLLQRSGSKNDAIDAWALADLLRRHAVERSVFKAPKTLTELRQAVRGYVAMRRDMVRAKCRFNALYRSRGVQPTAEIYDPEARERDEKNSPERSVGQDKGRTSDVG
jgi:transposase